MSGLAVVLQTASNYDPGYRPEGFIKRHLSFRGNLVTVKKASRQRGVKSFGGEGVGSGWNYNYNHRPQYSVIVLETLNDFP